MNVETTEFRKRRSRNKRKVRKKLRSSKWQRVKENMLWVAVACAIGLPILAGLLVAMSNF